MQQQHIPSAPGLSPLKDLKTLVENRRIYNMSHCELNLFETYQQAERVSLTFPDFVVTTMLKGKKIMHLETKAGFDYLPGSTVILPSNQEMRIDFPEASLDNPTQCLALTIDQGKIAHTLNWLNEKQPREGALWQLDAERLHLDNSAELAQLIERIIQLGQSSCLFKDMLVDLALQELLLKLIQGQNRLEVQQNERPSANAQLAPLLAWIKTNLQRRIDIASLARQAGLSASSLHRLFKLELGLSPVEYILIERVKLAKQYLAKTSYSIKTISYETGFEDSNYFSRVFKQHEGLSPKQYQAILQSTSA